MIVLLGTVPLAISGALVFSYLDLTTINIYSQVGLITLVGLVAKNGILIVEFANRLQERGLAKMEALRNASLTRLRPVLMTSAATVFGHFPLVLVTGPGAEARNSIGTVLVAEAQQQELLIRYRATSKPFCTPSGNWKTP